MKFNILALVSAIWCWIGSGSLVVTQSLRMPTEAESRNLVTVSIRFDPDTVCRGTAILVNAPFLYYHFKDIDSDTITPTTLIEGTLGFKLIYPEKEDAQECYEKILDFHQHGDHSNGVYIWVAIDDGLMKGPNPSTVNTDMVYVFRRYKPLNKVNPVERSRRSPVYLTYSPLPADEVWQVQQRQIGFSPNHEPGQEPANQISDDIKQFTVRVKDQGNTTDVFKFWSALKVNTALEKSFTITQSLLASSTKLRGLLDRMQYTVEPFSVKVSGVCDKVQHGTGTKGNVWKYDGCYISSYRLHGPFHGTANAKEEIGFRCGKSDMLVQQGHCVLQE